MKSLYIFVNTFVILHNSFLKKVTKLLLFRKKTLREITKKVKYKYQELILKVQTPYAFITKIFLPIRLFFILNNLCWIYFMFIISGMSATSLVIDGNLYITGVLPN